MLGSPEAGKTEGAPIRLLGQQRALSCPESARCAPPPVGPPRTQEVGHGALSIRCVPHTEVWQGPSGWAFRVRKPEGGNGKFGLLALGPDRKL